VSPSELIVNSRIKESLALYANANNLKEMEPYFYKKEDNHVPSKYSKNWGNISDHYIKLVFIDTVMSLYKLPPIDKYVFIKVDTSNNYRCKNGGTIDNYFELKTYSHKLPDIGNYNVFFVGNTNTSYFPKSFLEKCSNCIPYLNGYLIQVAS
jgi:hypothetical protein